MKALGFTAGLCGSLEPSGFSMRCWITGYVTFRVVDLGCVVFAWQGYRLRDCWACWVDQWYCDFVKAFFFCAVGSLV